MGRLPRERSREISPDSIERAVRDIEDSHHPKDQRQADGDDKDERRLGDTVEQGEQEQGKVHEDPHCLFEESCVMKCICEI